MSVGIECPTCKGWGSYEAEEWTGDRDYIAEVTVACEECDGTGYISKGKDMTDQEDELLQLLHELGHADEPNEIARRFLAELALHPERFEAFEKFTFEAIRAGYTYFSPWMVANRVRWETTIERPQKGYKVSNDFIGLYSRLFMARYPKYDGFFQTKKMTQVPGL